MSKRTHTKQQNPQAMPKAESEPAMTNKGNDSVTADEQMHDQLMRKLFPEGFAADSGEARAD